MIKKEKSFSGKKSSNESKSSNEELAASIGFRNGVYPRLQGYQPQWISSQQQNQQHHYQQQQQQQRQSSNNFKRNQALFEQQQNFAHASEIQHRGSSFRINPSNENLNVYNNNNNNNNNSSKLKYSESARNNYSHKEMGRSVQDLTRTHNVNYNSVYEEYATPNEFFMDENTEFILKPAMSSTVLSSSHHPNYKNQILVQDPNYISSLNRERMTGVFIPVKPGAGNTKNKKNLSSYNPLNEYNQQANFQSDPDIAKNAKYVHHDVYY